MEMQLSLSRELKMETRLVQLIEFSRLMAVPDEVLNTIVGAISFNPDSIESRLKEKHSDKGSNPDNSEKVQNLYASLVPSKGELSNKRNSGLVISPDIGYIKGCIGQCQSSFTPDVTYIGRKNEKPEIVFSDHLRGSSNLIMLQLDASKYPETSKLVSQLRKFDDWKRGTLRDAYVIIGWHQREFFEDLDSTRLNLFKSEDLADELELSNSTVSRILSNRWAEGRDITGNQRFFYTKDLLVTKDELSRYMALPVINEMLQEEFERKKAYSDGEITKKVGNLARRTIAKYRLHSGIPHVAARQRAYLSGERTEAYKII